MTIQVVDFEDILSGKHVPEIGTAYISCAQSPQVIRCLTAKGWTTLDNPKFRPCTRCGSQAALTPQLCIPRKGISPDLAEPFKVTLNTPLCQACYNRDKKMLLKVALEEPLMLPIIQELQGFQPDELEATKGYLREVSLDSEEYASVWRRDRTYQFAQPEVFGQFEDEVLDFYALREAAKSPEIQTVSRLRNYIKFLINLYVIVAAGMGTAMIIHALSTH